MKFKAIVLFLATCPCALGRPPHTIVWPRKEETLDTDIDSLLQEYPDRDKIQPVVPSSAHSFTESPLDIEATPPSSFRLPEISLDNTPSPEHSMIREPRFWSRIDTTTTPGHRNHAPPSFEGPGNWRSIEGSVHPPLPEMPEDPGHRLTSTQLRDRQSNLPEIADLEFLNSPRVGPASWGSRDGSGLHPPPQSQASPFNPTDRVHFQKQQPVSHQFRDRHSEQPEMDQIRNPPFGGPVSWGAQPHSPASPFNPTDQVNFEQQPVSHQLRNRELHQSAIVQNQDPDLKAHQSDQKDEALQPLQNDLHQSKYQDDFVDQFQPVDMGLDALDGLPDSRDLGHGNLPNSRDMGLDSPQETRSFRQPPESSQHSITKSRQQESLSERAAAALPRTDVNHVINTAQISNSPGFHPNQNLPSPNQRQALHLQSPITPRPWYMPRRANCRPIEKVVKVQQCEPYTVETCWQEAKQECNPQPVTNCTGVVETKYEQVCFNVVDELCSLMETVETEKTEDSYQVQDCFFGHEKEVCGITHEVEKFDKDDYDCATVKVLACHQVPQYVHDVNCIDSVEFDCKEDGYQPGTYLPKIVCTQNPIKNCYKIPRKVYREVCETIERRHCEAFNNVRAMPVEKQVCKPYTKKSCDFKIETSPKINKNFNYEVVCRAKPREICEHVEAKIVSPDCETSERLSCKYVPWKHRCKYDPKHYCHLVDKVVEEEVCDTVYGYAMHSSN